MPTNPAPTDTEEWWVPTQVAAYMQMNYQEARDAMLEGKLFGPSEYDATKRRLTVRASLVREAKAQSDARRKQTRKRRPKRGK